MTGVRSSCDASAMNWRRRASDAVRWSKASSIFVIIVLSASAELPGLGAGRDLGHAVREVAAGDRGRGLGHPLDRPQTETEHEEGDEREDREDRPAVTAISTRSMRDIDVDTSCSDSASERPATRRARAAGDDAPLTRRR